MYSKQPSADKVQHPTSTGSSSFSPFLSKVSSPKFGKMAKRTSKNYSLCMLYDTEAVCKKLENLTLAKCNPFDEETTQDTSSIMTSDTTALLVSTATPTVSESESDKPEELISASPRLQYSISDKMSCSSCGVDFVSRHEQREHYRSDWHRFNLKMRLKGFNCVTESEFDDKAADISSLSGSNNSSDSESQTDDDKLERFSQKIKKQSRYAQFVSEQKASSGTDSDSQSDVSYAKARRYPKIFFTTQDGNVVSLYRCVLYHKSETTSFDYIKEKAQDLTNHMKWAVLMCGGGHFAGAIFDGFHVICHKTFHRYIVRAKRGTAQSSKDSQGGNAPKSAGASIRRHNEAALTQEIQELISSWESHISTCDLIFIRAPSFNSRIFFTGKKGKNALFNKSDLRIRSIPFQTKRPTFNEVKRVHEILASLECYGKEQDIQGFVLQSPRRQLSAETGKLEVVEDDVKNETDQSDFQLADSFQQSQHSIASNLKHQHEFDGNIITNTTSNNKCSISDRDLFEYEYTRVLSPRKIRKKKEINSKALEEDHVQKEKNHMRNSLYTACKTGDLEILKKTIETLRFYSKVESSAEETDLVESTEMGLDTSPIMPLSFGSSNDHTASRSLVEEESCDGLHLLDENEIECVISAETTEQKQSPKQNTLSLSMSDILNGAFDEKQSTVLHLAAQLGHKNLIVPLLEAGANPAVKNKYGQLAYNMSLDKETRNSFRRFMGKYPDKFDYNKAQIPAPLSAEQELEKKQKKAEKNKTKKKLKQIKISEIKKKELKKKAEEEEKQKFAILSDREKRALAAEKRFLSQLEQADVEVQVNSCVSRCWFCGTDLTGKTPFEYFDYKFCSSTCLQQHRKLATSSR